MARTQKNLLSSIAGLSEDAIQKLADAPGADKLLGAVGGMRERMDDMQKRLRGLEGLDRRIAAIEKRLDKLDGGTRSSGSKTGSAAKKTTTTKSSGGTATRSKAREGGVSGGAVKKA